EVVREGHTLKAGQYAIVDEATEERHGPVTVLGIDDLPELSFYDQQLDPGFGYLTMRDGVQLSANVLTPDESLYGPAPWPTVIEYSGYGPSNPDAPQPGSLIANLLGFAVVGVNLRGSGCSGGIYDVFSAAQSADGYDIVEIVARQDWVLHNRPGMVGLSYPGNTQLFVGATRPPSLAAITPLSVLDDLWRQQWPGGIYNSGFTRVWIEMRDAETKMGGQAWDAQRIANGDEIAAANQQVRTIDLDFARFGSAMDTYRDAMRERRAADLVGRIDVPVYLTGSWQDEQTGSRAALMLDRFTGSPHTVFTFVNGHHPDGYSPMLINRWFEFLTFYVAQRIPQVHPMMRELAPAVFAEHFGYTPVLEGDRFTEFGDDYDAALAAYAAEPPVRLLFESGAANEVAGSPGARFETVADAWPIPETEAMRLWLGTEHTLISEPPAAEASVSYRDDPDAGAESYALTDDFDAFIQPTIGYEWTRFPDGAVAGFETIVTETFTVAGQPHLDLWLRPGTSDTAVQVTLTEIRPDGDEVRVQTGYHRPVHRVEERPDEDLVVDYTFAVEDREALVPGEWIRTRVPFLPVAHVFRKGVTLRLGISTPGRDHPFWRFESPVVEGASHEVGVGGAHASGLVLPVIPTPDHPVDPPAAHAIRGQVTRPALPL
ncbi:MAG TPA: CocE/NonD family hydrolase, partial [Acidimicrobiales bacterium]|nr:CocE/NonD family hydrolase [Acidimicrobiales bacterium]